MLSFKQFQVALALAVAAAMLAGGAGALASPPGGAPNGQGPHGQMNRPVILSPNPNGIAPIGKPSHRPDTDRGMSEGKGHNDRARIKGRVISFPATFSGLSAHRVTLMTPNGQRTFAISENVFDKLSRHPGAQFTFMTKDGRVVNIR
jgi:hypothetical protein